MLELLIQLFDLLLANVATAAMDKLLTVQTQLTKSLTTNNKEETKGLVVNVFCELALDRKELVHSSRSHILLL